MSFESEEHGRYLIRSGPISGRFGANAYRGKQLVAKVVENTREAAIESVKTTLAQVAAQSFADRDPEGAPSADVYQEALVALLPTLPESYIAMLQAHFSAPDHLLSATKLAEAAGYAGYEGANLHYGKLGLLVAEEIGFDPPKREDGTPIWTCVIARDPSNDSEYRDTPELHEPLRNPGFAHYQWQLRPQVVGALRALGWSR